jgi:hypothetical protein
MNWTLGTLFQTTPSRNAHNEIVLASGSPLRLTWARGRRVTCERGRVWITAPGEPGDIFLSRGQSWKIPGHGLVLIEAEPHAVITLDC